MSKRVLHGPQLLRAKRRSEPLRLLVVGCRQLPGAGRRAACRRDFPLWRLYESFVGGAVVATIGYLVRVPVLLRSGVWQSCPANVCAGFTGQAQDTGYGERTVEHI